ncbi:PPE domain-containing protein, partial [Mycobacterium simiae]
MTQTQNMQVVSDELLARAAELEAVIKEPSELPWPPCLLPMIINAAAEIAFSANAMRTYLDAGNRARKQLAQALRQAAQLYEATDEQAAQSLNGAGDSGSAATPHHLLGDYAPGTGPSAGVGPHLGPGPVVGPGKIPPPPPYYPVRQAAADIASADQGAACNAFAQAWSAYQQPLLDSAEAFRPFVNWEGTAATAVAANFEQFRQWVYQMANLCQQLAAQAQGVTSAHSWAVSQHPTVAQIAKLDNSWNETEEYKTKVVPTLPTGPFVNQRSEAEREVHMMEQSILKTYTQYQSQSESVLAEYAKKANLPLPALDPPAPPQVYS